MPKKNEGQTSQRYVSSELAHFVGQGLEEEQQYQLLLKILNEGWITHPPHNPKIRGNLSVKTSSSFSSNEMYCPQIVCFCDIPIADLDIHITKYSPLGLSFNKDFVVKQGGCPVFYLPLQAKVQIRKEASPEEMMRLLKEDGSDALFENIGKGQYFDRMTHEFGELMKIFQKLIMENSQSPGVPKEHIRLMELESFISFHIFSYIKFYDHSLTDDHADNYYLEREWRVVGNVEFDLNDVETVFMPKQYSQRFKTDCPLYRGHLVFI